MTTGASSVPGTAWNDERLMPMLGDLWDRVDPAPAGLVGRITLAVAIAEVHDEAARIVDDERVPTVAAGLRAGAQEQARTITFSASSLTIMVSVTPRATGTVRLDGWLAPAGDLLVSLLLPGETRQCPVGTGGRFVFEEVPTGTVQLVVGPRSAGGGPVVHTPAVEL